MTDAALIAQTYVATWNETDPARRAAMLAEHWAGDARYLDPLMSGIGHVEIGALIAAAQQRFPGFRFALHGKADGHNDRVRFSWSLAPAGSDPVVIGTDFVELAADGRIRSVTGFLDRVPAGV
ncbi:nuclear transport factor 2 family protein [Azospirillum thermophilum]|uniref:Polyketide cyclase n=1 Tax=Azospirillum thermophilum TaxID=2202148 RepID=A0A2S2CXH1_9PROT|nr:nuclear transport factor 2 family protein [Azospirillum thermophilum]AWK89148.1 polyketide cyclase [Azospirillum thermophilum]